MQFNDKNQIGHFRNPKSVIRFCNKKYLLHFRVLELEKKNSNIFDKTLNRNSFILSH